MLVHTLDMNVKVLPFDTVVAREVPFQQVGYYEDTSGCVLNSTPEAVIRYKYNITSLKQYR
jgi:hypothetical protein